MPTPDKTYSLRSSESLHSPSWLNDSIGSNKKSNRPRNVPSSGSSEIKSRLRGRETISPPVWLTGAESLKRKPSRLISEKVSGKGVSKAEKKTTVTRKRRVIERNLDTHYEDVDMVENAEVDVNNADVMNATNTQSNIANDNLDNTYTTSNNIKLSTSHGEDDSIGTDEDQYFDANSLDDLIDVTEKNGHYLTETVIETVANTSTTIVNLETNEEQTLFSTDDSKPIIPSSDETDTEVIVINDAIVEVNPIVTTSQHPDQTVTLVVSQSTSVYIDITRKAFEKFGASRFLLVISGQGTEEENEQLKLITSSSNILLESECQSKSNLDTLSSQTVAVEEPEISEATASTVLSPSPAQTSKSEVVELHENVTTTSAADNRQSFDGGHWKSRQSFLPSPSPSQVSYSVEYSRENAKSLNSILNSQDMSADESNENLLRRSDKYLSSSALENATSIDKEFVSGIDISKEERYQHSLQPIYDRKRDASSQYFELPFSKRRAFEEYNTGVTTNGYQRGFSILGSGYSSLAASSQQLKSYTPSQMTVLDTPSTQQKSAAKGNIATLSDVLIHPARQSISASKKQTMSFLQRRKYDEKSRGNEPATALSVVKSIPPKSETKASAVIANRILSSLSTLASPLEEQSNRQTNLGNQSVLQRFGISSDKTATNERQDYTAFVSSNVKQSKVSSLEKFSSNHQLPAILFPEQKKIQATEQKKMQTAVGVDDEFIFKPPKHSAAVSTEQLNNLLSTDSIKFSFSPPGARSKPRPAHKATSDFKEKAAVPTSSSTTKTTDIGFQLPAPSIASTFKPTTAPLPLVMPPTVTSQPFVSIDMPAKDSPWALAIKKDTIKCPSCFVPNEKTAIKCVSCENILAVGPKSSSNIPKAAESFGGSISSGGFQFSMPKVTSAAAATVPIPTQPLSLSNFSSTATTPSFGFSFTAPSQEGKSDKGFVEKTHETTSSPPIETESAQKKRTFNEESSATPAEIPLVLKPFSPPKPFSSSSSSNNITSAIPPQTSFSFSEASNKSSGTSSTAVNFGGFTIDSHPSKVPVTTPSSFSVGNPPSSSSAAAAPFMFGQILPSSSVKPDVLVSQSKSVDIVGTVGGSTTDSKLGAGTSSGFSFSLPSTTLPTFSATPLQTSASSSTSSAFSFGGGASSTAEKSASDKPSGLTFGAPVVTSGSVSNSGNVCNNSSVSNSNIKGSGEAPMFGSIAASDKPVLPFMFGANPPAITTEKPSTLTTFGGSSNDKQQPFPAFGALNGNDKVTSTPATTGMGLQLNVSDKPFGSPSAMFGSSAVVSGMDSPNSAMDMGSGYNSGDGSNMGFSASALGTSTSSQPFPSFANSLVPTTGVAASPFSFGGNAGSTLSSGIAFGSSSSSGNQNSFMFQGSSSGIALPKTDGGAAAPFGFSGQSNFGNPPVSGGMFGAPQSATQQPGGAFSLGSSDPNKGAAPGARRKLKAKRP